MTERSNRDSGEGEVRRVAVPPGAAGRRLDLFLADEEIVYSRAFGQKLIRAGRVRVNGEEARPSRLLEPGDELTVEIPPTEPSRLVPEAIDLDIRYEDEQLLVIDKPAGLVVHPGAGVKSGTLVNALLHRFRAIEGGDDPLRPGIVHRLDKETSGLLVVARTGESHARLGDAMRRREIRRRYAAVVWGDAGEKGTFDAPVGRSHRDRTRMAVVPEGRPAVTHYARRELFRYASLLDVKLETGRTHQIRVHFSHANHPVVGDATYGGREKILKGLAPPRRRSAAEALALMPRQALHAANLAFRHPFTGEELSFEAAIPADMAALIEFLRRDLAAHRGGGAAGGAGQIPVA